MRSPKKVDTSTDPDTLELFFRISCFRNGKAVTGGSSGTVTEYDCRMLGILSRNATGGVKGRTDPELRELIVTLAKTILIKITAVKKRRKRTRLKEKYILDFYGFTAQATDRTHPFF